MRQFSAALSAYALLIFPALAEEVPHDVPAPHAAEDMHGAAEAAGHAAEAAGHGAGLPQFDITTFPSQIFWLAVTFVVLYVFFSRKTLPDISAVIDNRRNHIQSDLGMAEKLTAEAESVQTAYETGLQGARDKATQTITDTENSMKQKAASEYESFRKRSETEIKAAESRIETAKIKAMDDMNTIAAEVAAEAVEKIIGIGTDTSKVKAIVESLSGKARAA